jgi:hypothetical protein
MYRVVVDVHDLAVRRRHLRDLVSVVRAGQAGAGVEELADAFPLHQVPARPAEEPPVRTDAEQDIIAAQFDHPIAGRAA